MDRTGDQLILTQRARSESSKVALATFLSLSVRVWRLMIDCDSNARRRLEFFGEFETAYALALVRLVTVRALVLLWLLLIIVNFGTLSFLYYLDRRYS